MNELGKIPPQALEIEDALIGLFLIERESLEHLHKLSAEMFYKYHSQLIFKTIIDILEKSGSIDILTVTEHLREIGELEKVGGAGYITKLTFNVVGSYNLESYIAIIKQKYIQRELIRLTSKVNGMAYESDKIDECQSILKELNLFIDKTIVGNINGKDILSLTNSNLESAARRKINYEEGVINGINTGFFAMQQITGGWQKQDLIYLASRPSMGKTAVSIHFAKMAVNRGFKVLFFSLEMSDISITDRMILGETNIDPEKWRNGNLTEKDLQEYESTKRIVKSWKFRIYDKSGIKASEIKTVCRKEMPDMIIIDYIQLMIADGKYQNRTLELGSISRDLKGIAKEFDLPVIALAQLNRGIENRANKQPTLSDLRDSGELEQDADLVIFPYRNFVYSDDENDKGKIEFIIAKHRNGRVGKFEASHNEYLNSFYDKQIEQGF